MTNLIGQSLGRYHILEQIGEGGMATVYKAYDTRLERDVAVKIIRKSAFSAEVLERVLQRFEREAKALAKLSHPNILKILDYGEYEGSPYLVLEYMSGGTLREQMGKPIPWQSALRILLPVARGLAYAHQRGIIHRDVKPSNILITESGEPMLTDFGIAKLLEADDGHTLTGTGVGIGTPEYMAPEQGLGKPVDGRADLYSLGIVFYELVTGKKPYTAETPMAVVFKHMTDPLPRPTQYVPDLPDAVEKVLIKALAKQPENRYEDLGAFARALQELANQSPAPVETMKSAPLISDSQVTLDEIPVSTSSWHKSEKPGNAGVKPPFSAQKAKNGWGKPGVLKYWPVIGAMLLLGLLMGGLWRGDATTLFTTNKPTQRSSLEPTHELVATSTETPSQIPQPLKTVQITPTVQIPTITPTFGPLTLIFEQNFDKNVATGLFPSQGEWKVTNGGDGNKVFAVSKLGNWSYAKFGAQTISSGTIEYRVKINDDSDTSKYALAFVEFRITDTPSQGYLFAMDLTNKSAFIAYDNPSYKWIVLDGASTGFTWKRDTWYKVRIEIMGTQIKVYLDDGLFLTAKDTRIQKGKIMLGVGWNIGVEFDDIRVWSTQ